MKIRILICLLFIVSGSLFAQSSKIGWEDKLSQLCDRSDIEVTEVEPDILKMVYAKGKVKYKKIGDYNHKALNKIIYSPTFDSTIIDLTMLDTIDFYQKYSYWQTVNVGSPYTFPPLVGDINNNGRPEIYAIFKNYNTDISGIVVQEINNYAKFDSIYLYDSTSTPRAIYDINKDGMKEILFRRYPPDSLYPWHRWFYYKKTSNNSLANELSFIFDNKNQQNDNTFGDWDGDEFTDQVLIGVSPHSIYFYEYNPFVNNFDSVAQYDLLQNDLDHAGFALGDFDQDGKTEFFAGGVSGNVISFENCGNNCYQQIWQGQVQTNNAYLLSSTKDIDGNGKPEIWVGGDYFDNGVGKTRITLFESNGNNSYQAVAKIDLLGVFSFYASNMQAIDVDKDGIDEMMVCIDDHVLILKFSGSVNHQSYEVYYLKRNDLANQGRNSVFYGATMYDLDNDGKEDIIIHMDDIISGVGMKLFTFIYKSNITVDVENEIQQPKEFYLHNNYPNPFNPSTQIKFSIPEPSNVTIKIYDILGKEITTLLDKEISPGSYNINWEAKDSYGQSLPSGVYLVRLNAKNNKTKYTRAIKAVLIK